MAYTLKAAKQWFAVNPKSRVIYHRRMAELHPSSRERMQMPRETTISGTRVRFSDGSELSLRTEDGTSRVSSGLLDVLDGAGQIIVTYARVA